MREETSHLCVANVMRKWEVHTQTKGSGPHGLTRHDTRGKGKKRLKRAEKRGVIDGMQPFAMLMVLSITTL